MQIHDVKCVQPYFSDVASGNKNFEVRFNDRDYQVGDILRLHIHPSTGIPALEKRIIYVLRNADQFGVKEGYVVLGLSKV